MPEGSKVSAADAAACQGREGHSAHTTLYPKNSCSQHEMQASLLLAARSAS